jgi:hypothetical protein
MRKSALIILLAAFGFAGWVFFSLLHVEPIKVVESRLNRTGESVSVAGSVENTGNDCGPIQVEVRYYDSNGRPLASDTVEVGALKSGASAAFHSPPHELENVSDYSIYLNHGHNPYGN